MGRQPALLVLCVLCLSASPWRVTKLSGPSPACPCWVSTRPNAPITSAEVSTNCGNGAAGLGRKWQQLGIAAASGRRHGPWAARWEAPHPTTACMHTVDEDHAPARRGLSRGQVPQVLNCDARRPPLGVMSDFHVIALNSPVKTSANNQSTSYLHRSRTGASHGNIHRGVSLQRAAAADATLRVIAGQDLASACAERCGTVPAGA